MRRLGGISMIATLLGGLLTASSAVATPAACNSDTVQVRTFRIRVAVQDDVYRLGDEAKIRLTVTRKQTEDRVSGALAAVMLQGQGKRVGLGWDDTDARGQVDLAVKIPRHRFGTGPVKVIAYAYQRQVDTYCASAAEYGLRRVPRAFRTTP
ncbi:MAG: hypothetical protein ACRDLB_07160 [Actinomycetota bacterium]